MLGRSGFSPTELGEGQEKAPPGSRALLLLPVLSRVPVCLPSLSWPSLHEFPNGMSWGKQLGSLPGLGQFSQDTGLLKINKPCAALPHHPTSQMGRPEVLETLNYMSKVTPLVGGGTA